MKEDGGTRQAVEAHQPGDDLRAAKKERRNGENWMMDGRATVRGMEGICVGFGLTCSLDLRDACAADGG